MALQSIQHEAAIGSAYAVSMTLRDGNGEPITTWTDAATLEARAWQGGDQATAFTPTASWLDAEAGRVRVAVAEGATDGLDPGLYQLALSIDGGPWNNIGTMRLTPGVGTAPAPAVYCTLLDMVALCPWIEQVEDLGPALAAGLKTNFLKQRALARVEIDHNLMSRAEDALGYQRRLAGPVFGFGTTFLGSDSGPYYGPSTLPDTSLSTDLEPIRAALAADGAVPTTDATSAEVLRRIAAYYALAIAMDGQIGGPSEGATYERLATKYRRAAIELMRGWRAVVEVDGAATYWL